VFLDWKYEEMKMIPREIYVKVFTNYTKGNIEKKDQIERFEEIRLIRDQKDGFTWLKNCEEIQYQLETEWIVPKTIERKTPSSEMDI
jgi:hypothetical protein